MTHGAVYLFSVISVFFCSCQKPKTEGVIARVGDALLTIEEAQSHIDTSIGNPTRQIHDYISYWTDNEVVYQEAKKSGFENSDQIRQQLDEIKKHLVIQAFLENQQLYDTAGIGENALREYFEAHTSEFFYREDMIKLNMAVFYEREPASAFSAAVSRGKAWEAAVQEFEKNAGTAKGIISCTAGQLFSQYTIYPPEIWKVAMSANIKEVTFPIKAGTGFYVLQPLAVFRQGSPAAYDAVKDEVRARVLIELKKKGYTELLSKLRKSSRIFVYLPADSTADTSQTYHYE